MTRPKSYIPLTPEERSVLQSRAGKKARAASPWNRGPNCGSYSAGLSYLRLKKKPTKLTATTPTNTPCL